MNIKIPWIISRRRKLIAASIDFFICTFLYNFTYRSEFNAYPNKLVTFTFAFFWIVISYVLGRYIRNKEISFISIFKAFLKSSFLFGVCNIIYLLINFSLPILFFWSKIDFFNNELILLSNFFTRVTLFILLSSTVSQYLFSIITYSFYNKKKSWIFYGTEQKYQEVLNELSLQKRDLKFFKLNNAKNLNTINFDNIEGIIIEDFESISRENIDIIFNLKLRGIIVESLLSWFENKFHRIPSNIISNKYQLLEKLKPIEDNYQLRFKRIGDIAVSFLIIFITLPITLLICFFIFIEDRGPIFYSQKRTGLKGKIINIYKFRSMKIDAEKNGIQWAQKSDPRITKTGSIIRATRLDELPQLFCVIKGDMSLIGPRPERPEIEENSLLDIPYYSCRSLLKPGISGWAQVNYPYGNSILDAKKKLSFDIYYISHFSFLLDLLILFKTLKIILNAKNFSPKK